jgi:FtsP/CotA-like multicopper oxidase with cupredoxin domain
LYSLAAGSAAIVDRLRSFQAGQKMSDQNGRRQASEHRWISALSVTAVLLSGPTAAFAGDFVEPQVFASSNGVLDLLMIAKPQAVPSISYFVPNTPAIHPVGWVYEICPRSAALPGNLCPAGAPTVADYGGVRLALQKGDALKIRLVNRLPLLRPVKVYHSIDPGGDNLPLNLTNLHTHGMVVEARAPTLSEPTWGDNIFVQIYNSANGTPVPLQTHQHGSIVKDYADYRIDIPANHPSGAFWFHPHIHGLSLNQVTSGLAGIISVGSAGDYAFGDLSGAQFPESSVRHLILKDMQVMAANPVQKFANGTSPTFNGEVLNQQAALFCNQSRGEDPPRLGSCPGVGGLRSMRISSSGSNAPPPEFSGGDYVGGQWFFTVSGEVYPTIHMTEPDGELWRLTSASPSLTYDLKLINDATFTPMIMQLISVDGVSINIPPETPPGTLVKLGGARFNVVTCPANSSGHLGTTPVCIDEFAMMPSSRAELWVTYRDSSGNVVTPPAGATATFKMVGITTGPVGDLWPQIDLATVRFEQSGPRRLTASALDVRGDARTANLPKGIFGAPVPYAKAGPVPAGCRPLAAGHRRRIFFGFPDVSNSSIFGLGYEEVDGNGAVVAGTQIPITDFNPSTNSICVPLGPWQTPVHEIWEIINLATENHNFHIHQTKFRVIQDGATPGSLLAAANSPDGPGIMEDNIPLPVAIANIAEVGDLQSGYCTIAQWRSGQCTSVPVVIDIPFSQLGEFVYHCHILTHEDGGMMAKIQVVPAQDANYINKSATHDFSGDSLSDILWRNSSSGATVAWLMNGGQVTESGTIATVPNNWKIVGQRDFNGDGKADLLWRDTNTGTVVLWLMNGLQVTQSITVATVASNWVLAGVADFNGDGKADLLWRDSNTGTVAIWLMNGGTVTQTGTVGTVPSSWSIVGTSSDGHITWRNSTNGAVVIWDMNGFTVSQTHDLGAVAVTWAIVGIGDFDGNGSADLLWRNSNTGAVAIWFMTDGQVTQSASFGVVANSWTIDLTGDFNGDGKSDIVWTNITNGTRVIWFMDGAQMSQSVNLGTSATSWMVQSANAD